MTQNLVRAVDHGLVNGEYTISQLLNIHNKSTSTYPINVYNLITNKW